MDLRSNGEVTVSKDTTLRVTGPTATEFNLLKIRLASATGQISSATAIVQALVKVGNAHYDELLIALAEQENPE